MKWELVLKGRGNKFNEKNHFITMKKTSITIITFMLVLFFLILVGVSYMLNILSSFIAINFLPAPVVFLVAALITFIVGILKAKNNKHKR